MERITDLINIYSIPLHYIESSTLPHSGTGYYYPLLHHDKITTFYDQYGRQGYLFQLVVTNKTDGSKKRSSFIVHCRYPNDNNNVVYSGLNELYYDCCIRQHDKEKFLKRLESLLKDETINNWYEKEDYPELFDICKDLQFELSVQDINDIEQRQFLVVQHQTN
jgi:hypothetical protein